MFENDASLQSPPRELNMQCINNNFHPEHIQTPPMLTEKEAQSLASTKEYKQATLKTLYQQATLEKLKIYCRRFLPLIH